MTRETNVHGKDFEFSRLTLWQLFNECAADLAKAFGLEKGSEIAFYVDETFGWDATTKKRCRIVHAYLDPERCIPPLPKDLRGVEAIGASPDECRKEFVVTFIPRLKEAIG